MSEHTPRLHLARCVTELVGMYAREVATKVGACVLDALDVFGDDSAEDAAIHSEVWGRVAHEGVADDGSPAEARDHA
jgi:hypothetical protein